MRSVRKADNVIEALRRGPSSHERHEAGIRLQTALLQGRGHIVITGDSQHETETFVDEVLRDFDERPVEHVYAGAQHFEVALDRMVLVVHGAESARAEQLENLRMALEHGVDTVERIRVVLVGSPALERTLADPDARALTSRVGTFIRLDSRRPLFRVKAPVRRRRRMPHPLVGSAVLAAAAVVLATFTDLPPEREAGRVITAGLGLVMPVAQEAGALLAAGTSFKSAEPAARRTVAATAPQPTRRVMVAQPGVLAAARAKHDRTPPQAGTDAGAGSSGAHIRSGGAGYSALPVYTGAAHAATGPAAEDRGPRHAAFFSVVRSGSWSGSSGLPASDALGGRAYAAVAAPRSQLRSSGWRLTADERRSGSARGTDGAVLETLLMSRELDRNPTYDAPSPTISAGAYDDIDNAFALKSVLAGFFDLLAVARTEPQDKPVYSVRVFNLDTDEEIRNVEQLMTADDVPVEIFD